MADFDFTVRVFRYAIQHLRNQIYKDQRELIELRQQLEYFPDSAMSDWSVRFGDSLVLSEEAMEADEQINFLVERMRERQSDYDFLANGMNEYDGHCRSAMFKEFAKSFEENQS